MIVISSILLFLLHNREKSSNEKKEKTVNQEKNIGGKELLKKLLKDNSYKEIDINNEVLTKKYNALKGPLIYYYDIESLKEIESNLIFGAITYDIQNNDIKETSSDDNYTYGVIEKNILDNKIKELFGPTKIKITKNTKSDYISINYGTLENVDQKYRNAVLMNTEEDNYNFRFYGAEGTSASPILKPVPIKLVEAREFSDYILVVSKAIYSSPIDLEDDQWKIKVCSDSKCKKVIKEIKIVNEHYYTLNIDEYINEASTIYTIFKKDNKNYYYYKNIIDN